jgi:hypothetical protein
MLVLCLENAQYLLQYILLPQSLMTKWLSRHYVTGLDTRTQFRVHNICYRIIPYKQIL